MKKNEVLSVQFISAASFFFFWRQGTLPKKQPHLAPK